eukprot:CAMPEP_0197882736 /NCGR_PEP_ID=MMETSP1439-20131203/9783_1 /TAXON_ID=66791 /ORGANISM="Gonyaulax spinifera, Strain CCMP409" /LENGTH=76 /DNA_ID=CAMNT_0043502407 /DNA_START=1122 /DNA_END=1351 /DNA_ORIENTATION=+
MASPPRLKASDHALKKKDHTPEGLDLVARTNAADFHRDISVSSKSLKEDPGGSVGVLQEARYGGHPADSPKSAESP